MMLVAISTGKGLQNAIKNKVSSFFGHISVTNFQNSKSESSIDPIKISESDLEVLAIENVNHIQSVAYKTGLITTDLTFEGAILKGINSDFNYKTFSDYMKSGKIPLITDSLTLILKFLMKEILRSLEYTSQVSQILISFTFLGI